MADSKKLVKRLPDTYQELEYIQSGSLYWYTGYIDTGLVGTDLYGCEIETCMKVTAITTANLYYINGAYVAGNVTQTGLIREDTEYVHSTINMGFNTTSYSGSIALSDWHTMYTSDGIQKTDDIIVSNKTYGTFNNLRYLLFARSDTGVTLSPPFAMKYFWIKKNGQYIRNMIPAKRKSDNVVGMYDIANDVFYTSENQYAFIGGSDVNNWQHSLRKLSTATDTLTTLPVDVYADGNNATVGLKGNTVQNGTPTPSNPVEVIGVGKMSENLMNRSDEESGYINSQGEVRTPADGWILSDYIPVVPNSTYTFNPNSTGGTSAKHAYYDSNKELISVLLSGEQTFITPNNAAYMRFSYRSNSVNIMLNTDSTAKPYEPYGYKIPISSASVTTPVYLGEVETTRKIKKLELTGTENWSTYNLGNTNTYFYRNITDSGISNTTPLICSEYTEQNIGSATTDVGIMVLSTQLRIRPENVDTTTKSAFLTYLQQQYAAGTPVTVWYVLATEETGIVNEPLMKIGNYADTVSSITIPTITGKDTFDVETTLKPSEASLSYTGWHDATVEEWDGSQWNE